MKSSWAFLLGSTSSAAVMALQADTDMSKVE